MDHHNNFELADNHEPSSPEAHQGVGEERFRQLIADAENKIAERRAYLFEHTATIKTWNQNKGFGFAQVPGLEEEVFVHSSLFNGRVQNVQKGQILLGVETINGVRQKGLRVYKGIIDEPTEIDRELEEIGKNYLITELEKWMCDSAPQVKALSNWPITVDENEITSSKEGPGQILTSKMTVKFSLGDISGLEATIELHKRGDGSQIYDLRININQDLLRARLFSPSAQACMKQYYCNNTRYYSAENELIRELEKKLYTDPHTMDFAQKMTFLAKGLEQIQATKEREQSEVEDRKQAEKTAEQKLIEALTLRPVVDKVGRLDRLSNYHNHPCVYHFGELPQSKTRETYTIFHKAWCNVYFNPDDNVSWQVLFWCLDSNLDGSRYRKETGPVGPSPDERGLRSDVYTYYLPDIDFEIPPDYENLPESLSPEVRAKIVDAVKAERDLRIGYQDQVERYNQMLNTLRALPYLGGESWHRLADVRSNLMVQQLPLTTGELRAFLDVHEEGVREIVEMITKEQADSDALEARKVGQRMDEYAQYQHIIDALPCGSRLDNESKLQLAKRVQHFTQELLNLVGGKAREAHQILEQIKYANYGVKGKQSELHRFLPGLDQTEIGKTVLILGKAGDFNIYISGALSVLAMAHPELASVSEGPVTLGQPEVPQSEPLPEVPDVPEVTEFSSPDDKRIALEALRAKFNRS